MSAAVPRYSFPAALARSFKPGPVAVAVKVVEGLGTVLVVELFGADVMDTDEFLVEEYKVENPEGVEVEVEVLPQDAVAVFVIVVCHFVQVTVFVLEPLSGVATMGCAASNDARINIERSDMLETRREKHSRC